MKIAIRKSGVFDPTFFSYPNTVLFDGDVKSKMDCFAFEELGFDSVVIKSFFWSCWAVNCAFQLSSILCIGAQAFIFVFFCPTTFLLTISAFTPVKLQPATVESLLLHTTLLALPCPVCSEHTEKHLTSLKLWMTAPESSQGPLSKSLCHLTILIFNTHNWYFKYWFWSLLDCKISE